MRFNLSTETGRNAANLYLNGLSNKVDITSIKETRSSQQNKALHLFFTIICQQLNEIGIEFHYTGIDGDIISMPFTPEIYKNFVWRELQKTMFGIVSTTKINTDQINQILDVITKHYADLHIEVRFPNKYDEYLKFSNQL